MAPVGATAPGRGRNRVRSTNRSPSGVKGIEFSLNERELSAAVHVPESIPEFICNIFIRQRFFMPVAQIWQNSHRPILPVPVQLETSSNQFDGLDRWGLRTTDCAEVASVSGIVSAALLDGSVRKHRLIRIGKTLWRYQLIDQGREANVSRRHLDGSRQNAGPRACTRIYTRPLFAAQNAALLADAASARPQPDRPTGFGWARPGLNQRAAPILIVTQAPAAAIEQPSVAQPCHQKSADSARATTSTGSPGTLSTEPPPTAA